MGQIISPYDGLPAQRRETLSGMAQRTSFSDAETNWWNVHYQDHNDGNDKFMISAPTESDAMLTGKNVCKNMHWEYVGVTRAN